MLKAKFCIVKFLPLFLSIIFFVTCTVNNPATNIKLPALFGDNQVLQQDMPIPVWGTGNPGGEVVVKLGDVVRSCIVNDDSTWRVNLPAFKAGGPFVMKIIGKDTLTLKNTMIGEVWLASGQSNMNMPLAGWDKIFNSEEEVAKAHYPGIRLFTVQQASAFSPQPDVTTIGWQICSPVTITEFSAVAYFFGRQLHETLDVAVGLIHSSWGGTVIEAWMSIDPLVKVKDFSELARFMQDSTCTEKRMLKRYQQQQKDWFALADPLDIGLKSGSLTFKDVDINTADWQKMEVPGAWEDVGLDNYDGIVWFRKEVMIPSSWIGTDVGIQFGFIDDIDITWFNGVQVGFTDYFSRNRSYIVPDSLVKVGKNIIAVRVIDVQGLGGLRGIPEKYKLSSSNRDTISLAGEWKFKPGVESSLLPTWPYSPQSRNFPTVLYNAMISPLIPYAIRGAIWYQGESNASRAFQYQTLFPGMIQDWRTKWKQGDFPFLFVQLANYGAAQAEPVEDQWAELREAQLMTLSLPNTGMAVTIDIGDGENIHPKNKQDVGKRLALIALDKVYDQDIPYSGPMYQSMTIEGNTIRLSFDHVYGGLVAKGDTSLTGFAIAGADKKFFWANAIIKGETIIVSNPQVENPVAVRYAWGANPVCNLYNKAGLPASPFRTDSWKGITQN